VETRSAMAHSSILRSRVSETTDGIAAGARCQKLKHRGFPAASRLAAEKAAISGKSHGLPHAMMRLTRWYTTSM
jgi:hypothetical protein